MRTVLGLDPARGKVAILFLHATLERVVKSLGFHGACAVKEPLSDAETRKDKLMLAVSDAFAAFQRLKAAGYAPGEIHEDARSGTKSFWISDPDGHRFEIIARPTAGH
jgi:catechol 2,3-dioxygenase-like lactoylglutathione lyase family enzyme